MKRSAFTEEQRAVLLKHPHIARVTNHHVSYTPAFKKFAVVEHRDKGRRPQDIFITEGIAVSIVGNDTPQRNVESWQKKVEMGGFDTLSTDGRGQRKGGRRKKKERVDEGNMSDTERIEYYKTKCAYIEAENDFLARTRGIPRMPPFVYRPGSNMGS